MFFSLKYRWRTKQRRSRCVTVVAGVVASIQGGEKSGGGRGKRERKVVTVVSFSLSLSLSSSFLAPLSWVFSFFFFISSFFFLSSRLDSLSNLMTSTPLFSTCHTIHRLTHYYIALQRTQLLYLIICTIMMPTATRHRIAALHSPSGHSDPINNLLLFPIGGGLRSVSEWANELLIASYCNPPLAVRNDLLNAAVLLFLSRQYERASKWQGVQEQTRWKCFKRYILHGYTRQELLHSAPRLKPR